MRVDNWSVVLAEKIEELRAVPFAWGVSDCFQFVGSIVRAISGKDYLITFPAYSTEAEALQILAANGGAFGILTACLGESKHAALAQRGDVVLIDMPAGPTCCICLGVWSAAIGMKGMVFERTLKASAAWSV